MKRLIPLTGLLLGLFVPFSPLQASGDYGCEPSWKLANKSLSDCANTAVLSPGNDTRVNMFFLLVDRQRAPLGALAYPTDWEDRSMGRNFLSWRLLRKAYDPAYEGDGDSAPFYGSRCFSVTAGAQAFGAAMAANRKLPAAERGPLAKAREGLVATCNREASAPMTDGIKSAPGREFLAYVQAADAFYGERWDAARQGFESLRKAGDPWVAETALYMLGRTALNAAQAGSFDEYGSFLAEKTDRAAVAQARGLFDAYLKRYGSGRYAASAQGLLRRTMWLSGDATGLAREYERLLSAAPATGPAGGELIQEVDSKLMMVEAGRSAVDSPMLLAAIDLMLMRDAEDSGVPVISAADLAAQEPRFAGRPDLFSFVTANHAFYVGQDPRRVLQLIPDDARQPSYAPLAFSRQVLRGMALAALKDRNEAGFWRELLGGATALYQRPVVELALAMNYERNGKLADVFAAGSPIGETSIREILLHNIAGPDLLRAQVKNAARPQHERDLALFTLLYKRLTHGDYAAFLTDSALVRADADTEAGLWDVREQEKIPVGLFLKAKWSESYACPALSATVKALARNAGDSKAKLCLGEFYQLNSVDYYVSNTVKPAGDELGGTPDLFPGKPAYRGKLYADVIADPRAAGGDKAYALFRSVMCYAPSGNNECGGADAPESQRKAWFQQLKRDYSASEWAKQLRYYW